MAIKTLCQTCRKSGVVSRERIITTGESIAARWCMLPLESALGLRVLSPPSPTAFQFPKAIDAYTKCLELDDKNVAVYCNRAFAHLKVEGLLICVAVKITPLLFSVMPSFQCRTMFPLAFGSALEDANVAIDLDPAFVKVLWHR